MRGELIVTRQKIVKPKKPPLQSWDPILPKSVANALADTWHAECARQLSIMRKQCKTAFSWSVWLDGGVLDALKIAEEFFITSMPRRKCPECNGQKKVRDDQCLNCRGGGYMASQV